MTIEKINIFKERAETIKTLLDAFFVDLQGSTYSGINTPLYNMSRENLRILKTLNDIIKRYKPDLTIEQINLNITSEYAYNAYSELSKLRESAKINQIKTSQEIQKKFEKTEESLWDIHEYFENKCKDK